MGEAIDAVTGTGVWVFDFFLPSEYFVLCCCWSIAAGCRCAMVRHLCAYPEERCSNIASFRGDGNDGFFSILPPCSASFNAAPETAVDSKPAENVVRTCTSNVLQRGSSLAIDGSCGSRSSSPRLKP